jgi:hypothetical protein
MMTSLKILQADFYIVDLSMGNATRRSSPYGYRLISGYTVPSSRLSGRLHRSGVTNQPSQGFFCVGEKGSIACRPHTGGAGTSYRQQKMAPAT